MKLLICTQAVDKNDPFLGFFHRWVEELSKHYEKITVICLKEGEHSLPPNVSVYSLGKEKNTSRPTRALRLSRYANKFKNEYDAVFVHMNQEYVLLLGWLWKRWKKRVYMWRNHYAGNKFTDMAARWCDKVFYTSKFSYTAKYPNAAIMPVGVDIDAFTRLPEVPRDPRSILFLGRIAPSKKPDLLLEALYTLSQEKVSFEASLYGAALPKDEQYRQNLLLTLKQTGLENVVEFHESVSNTETPKIYNSHSIFVNCSSSGMYDKTLFEAAACECVVLASSKDLSELVDPRCIFEEDNVEDLARKIKALLNLSMLERQGLGSALRNIARSQSIQVLGEKLSQAMQS